MKRQTNATHLPWLAPLLLVTLLAAGCSDGSDTPVYQPALSRMLEVKVQQLPTLPGYNIYRPDNLLATGGALPVIVWTNGGCVRHDATWSALLERWASAGFVALAPTTPADGSDPRSNITRVEDQMGAIDWAVAENQRKDSPFANRLDLKRIVAAGNSCGGIVALSLASADSRVRSVFVLSGSSTIPGAPLESAAAVMGNVLVPAAWVVGGPQDIATQFARQDYELLPVGVPGYLARRSEADHRTVSTDPEILQEVAEISIKWIDFTLYGHPQASRQLVESPCDECATGTWTIDAKDLELHTVR